MEIESPTEETDLCSYLKDYEQAVRSAPSRQHEITAKYLKSVRDEYPTINWNTLTEHLQDHIHHTDTQYPEQDPQFRMLELIASDAIVTYWNNDIIHQVPPNILLALSTVPGPQPEIVSNSMASLALAHNHPDTSYLHLLRTVPSTATHRAINQLFINWRFAPNKTIDICDRYLHSLPDEGYGMTSIASQRTTVAIYLLEAITSPNQHPIVIEDSPVFSRISSQSTDPSYTTKRAFVETVLEHVDRENIPSALSDKLTDTYDIAASHNC